MELILTSFGLSHLRRRRDSSNIFYRMPPVSMSDVNREFMPDYAVLLLCDRIIIDSETFQRLSSGEHYPSYSMVAEVIKALYSEGFVRIEDFDAIVSDKQELLERMLERDMRRPEVWVQPLRESAETWRRFVQLMDKRFGHMVSEFRAPVYDPWGDYLDALHKHYDQHYGPHGIYLLAHGLGHSTRRRRGVYPGAFGEELVANYLAYVNANLVVAHTLGVGFHDWYDFAPFYREKFLSIGQEKTREQERTEQVKRLFEVSFPEFTFWDAKSIVKALKDSRIHDLRSLVDGATRGEVEFDREFANRILREVVDVEQRLGRVRNIVSYVTLPIDFIPWVGTIAQRVVEELVGRVVEKRVKKEYRWFYLISELAGDS